MPGTTCRLEAALGTVGEHYSPGFIPTITFQEKIHVDFLLEF